MIGRRFTWGGALALALAGCSAPPPPSVAPAPSAPIAQAAPAAAPAPSAASMALMRHYQRLQDDLLTQGLLRGDGGGADTPFDAEILARNFIRIALFNEYREDGNFRAGRGGLAPLRRWEQPIAMQVQFSATVPPAQAEQDRAAVATFAARLSRLTGVPIRQTDQGGNFHVLFLDEDDRRAFGPQLRALVPQISDQMVRNIENLPRDQLCLVIGVFDPARASYRTAVALIRAEHPSLMRAACIHEELAQGMGLPNDSPAARPSIFNDDEEFALLTRHDEWLLRILYDPRLQAGMNPATAAPIAQQIARDYLSDQTM